VTTAATATIAASIVATAAMLCLSKCGRRQSNRTQERDRDK
jgi:hypothetical protein